ncbi:hypothetical protein LIER_17263 [Lithospermum erythrorhizon]|uniref:Reverse transcriptase Ty1/copia-type domain-containing protein n=1 Tax=Lithospermum erythrorhizon TaxID=34254 RepID=A0AAV3Q9M4_LITER
MRLAKEFDVKDLGMMKYFLGMEIARSQQGISVSQRKYTLDLLKETGMLSCKARSTSVELGNKNRLFKGEPVDKTAYQQLVGKLIYLSHTIPDITFTVSLVYTDADWAGSIDDRKSTSGYYTIVWGNLVTWRSKKQNMVARSSAKT